ncbi:7-cyano-7-deazaguanine synthase [Vibrio cholerae]|nr:7-cyano-7-deazaguanine synthase [Vibrio cholerae]EGR4418702.1 7-cyano-7-deazaguanine synthase [Vibrio cholerae]EGR4430191.1 7-cyano-7-deazaguanine synthase [Vibrio cholerae]
MSSVLLLSGGLDSIALAAWKKPEYALTINYGQVAAETEIRVSSQVSSLLGIKHTVITLDLSSLGSGLMHISGTKSYTENSEFWPYRNQFLITIASMFAIKHGCDNVLIGTVITDQRHIDGSEKFIDYINKLVSYQEGAITVSAPAKSLSTIELIRKSNINFDILSWGHSCHTGNLACGQCPGCIKHSEVMREFGVER